METILIGHPLDHYDEFSDLLSRLSEKYTVIVKDYDYQWLKRNIVNVDILIPSLKVPVDEEILNRAKQLRLIFTPSTGTDHIKISQEKKTIKLVSLHDFRDQIATISSTAELGFALLLAVSRRITLAKQDVLQKGRWDRNNFVGSELQGKTLGIIGMGRLGQKIAGYAEAFGMTIQYWDHQKTSRYKKINELSELLSSSDYIILSITYNEKTYHLMNQGNVRLLKKGASIINISRGKIIDEDSVCSELQKGTLAGIGVDVLEFELEDFKTSPLYRYAKKHPEANIVITPHIGGATVDAWKKVFTLITDTLLQMNTELDSAENKM
ncbi:MAG: NAD(P)-dependent oxidoreductase [Methanobacteriota archaeon]